MPDYEKFGLSEHQWRSLSEDERETLMESGLPAPGRTEAEIEADAEAENAPRDAEERIPVAPSEAAEFDAAIERGEDPMAEPEPAPAPAAALAPEDQPPAPPSVTFTEADKAALETNAERKRVLEAEFNDGDVDAAEFSKQLSALAAEAAALEAKRIADQRAMEDYDSRIAPGWWQSHVDAWFKSKDVDPEKLDPAMLKALDTATRVVTGTEAGDGLSPAEKLDMALGMAMKKAPGKWPASRRVVPRVAETVIPPSPAMMNAGVAATPADSAVEQIAALRGIAFEKAFQNASPAVQDALLRQGAGR
jgi:hypothetical protein